MAPSGTRAVARPLLLIRQVNRLRRVQWATTAWTIGSTSCLKPVPEHVTGVSVSEPLLSGPCRSQHRWQPVGRLKIYLCMQAGAPPSGRPEACVPTSMLRRVEEEKDRVFALVCRLRGGRDRLGWLRWMEGRQRAGRLKAGPVCSEPLVLCRLKGLFDSPLQQKVPLPLGEGLLLGEVVGGLKLTPKLGQAMPVEARLVFRHPASLRRKVQDKSR